MKDLAKFLAGAALAAFGPGATLAQSAGKTTDQLTPRGTPAASDLIPCLPSGGAALEGCTVSGLSALLTSIVATPCNGLADDTLAIQAALNSGLDVQLPPGVCVVSSPLLVQSYRNNGQTLKGSGSYYSAASVGFSTTPPPGTTVIRPTSAMSGKSVFVIDGTPIGGAQQTWVQGFGIENLAIDMANMADESTSVAIEQVQAWDGHYTGVRVLNDGVSKRGWLYKSGAFTTTMLNTQGDIIDMEGTGPGCGVTTVTVINHDGFQAIVSWSNGIKIIGGAFQGAGPHFTISNSEDVDIRTDVEGSGTYLVCENYTAFIRTQNELGGFTGPTYYSGACGESSDEWDHFSTDGSYPSFLTKGSVQLNNRGVATFSAFYSGGATADSDLRVGRTGLDALFGVAGAAHDYVSGTAQGDAVLSSWAAGSNLWLGAAQVPGIEITPTGVNIIDNGSGSITTENLAATSGHFKAFQVTPGMDGQNFTLTNAGGSGFFLCTTATSVENSYCAFGAGAGLNGYSDAGFGTLTWKVNSATGGAQFQGLTVQPAVDGATFTVDSNESAAAFSVNTSSTAATDVVYTPGTVQANAFKVNSTAGVTCSGTPTASFAVTNGIVTHC
jgi:hypothetical protein